MKLFAVGGAVRDHLLNSTGSDLDFAVEAESFEQMTEGLRERGLLLWLSRPQFVTVRGRLPLTALGRFGGLIPGPSDPNPLGKVIPLHVAADFTLCRKEGMYHDNRHPSTVTPADLKTDLSRRDFTMNAIAISEDGEVIDPHKGQIDLKQRVIRAVGDPRERFTEDPLRILRAIRFAVKLDFRLDGSVRNAMREFSIVKGLGSLPVERVHEELNRALKYDWHWTMEMLFREVPAIGQTIAVSFPELWFRATTEDR